MGDRGNIVVKQSASAPPIHLYTHWGGTELPQVLRDALKLRERWDDPPYLTRLIVREMGMGEKPNTGFGISVEGPPDNEHPILTVDLDTQRVTCGDGAIGGKASWSFEEYASLESPSWDD